MLQKGDVENIIKKRMKTKLPKLSTIRTKCDNLLTPIIKLIFPKCLLCGKDTEVAHHHFHKSESNRLRYELDNLINLCQSCHLSLHMRESHHASRIVVIKGVNWFVDLEKKKWEYVKADVHWYIAQHKRLQELYEDLCKV